MKKLKLIFTFWCFILVGLGINAQALSGKMVGKITSEVPDQYLELKLLQSGNMIGTIPIPESGEFSIPNLEPGVYDVIIFADGKEQRQVNEILITMGTSSRVDVVVQDVILENTPIYGKRIFKIDETISGLTLDKTFIRELPVRNVKEMALLAPGITTTGRMDGGISIRGARPGATAYYVDGVKVVGDIALPNRALGQMRVMTGGLPAEFGDTVGGVIAISTHNPGMYIR